MKKLVENLIREWVLKSPQIIKAFLQNDRRDFVQEAFQSEAYLDHPLPIGEGQTISQPYTVAFMLELLAPQRGERILDIGFGSGWTTALLASIVGEEGEVYGVEIVPEIFEFGAANLKRRFARGQTLTERGSTRTVCKIGNIALYNQSGWDGLPAAAPFDKILVSAAAPKVPLALKDQLKIGGRLVIPVGRGISCSIKVLKKMSKSEFVEEDYPGFAFVPFVKTS